MQLRRKRIVSLFIVMVLVLSAILSLSIAAFSDPMIISTWTDFKAAMTPGTGIGNYELGADIVVEEPIQINGNISIDGKNHTINLNGNNNITVGSSRKLTLTNTTVTGYSGANAAIKISNGLLTLGFGTIITGNTVTRRDTGVVDVMQAAGVDGLRLLPGSKITNNKAIRGGGVYLTGGYANISGEISHNTAEVGGGVWVDTGVLLLDGATIKNNKATEGGGGVYLAWHKYDANANTSRIDVLGDSTIADNEAPYGAGIFSDNRPIYANEYGELDGSTEYEGNLFITGNIASYDGGGIYYSISEGNNRQHTTGDTPHPHDIGIAAETYGVLQIKKANVINNTANNKGANIFINAYKSNDNTFDGFALVKTSQNGLTNDLYNVSDYSSLSPDTGKDLSNGITLYRSNFKSVPTAENGIFAVRQSNGIYRMSFCLQAYNRPPFADVSITNKVNKTLSSDQLYTISALLKAWCAADPSGVRTRLITNGSAQLSDITSIQNDQIELQQSIWVITDEWAGSTEATLNKIKTKTSADAWPTFSSSDPKPNFFTSFTTSDLLAWITEWKNRNVDIKKQLTPVLQDGEKAFTFSISDFSMGKATKTQLVKNNALSKVKASQTEGNKLGYTVANNADLTALGINVTIDSTTDKITVNAQLPTGETYADWLPSINEKKIELFASHLVDITEDAAFLNIFELGNVGSQNIAVIGGLEEFTIEPIIKIYSNDINQVYTSDFTLPATGGNGILWISISGAFLLLFGLIAFLAIKKKC